jgi:hypothetical protein
MAKNIMLDNSIFIFRNCDWIRYYVLLSFENTTIARALAI